MFPSSDGRLAAIWLDGRKMKDEETGDMSLMYTTIGSDGRLGTEVTLDGRTCECCQTSATTTPDGPLVVYRDRSDKEIRDISIVRYTNGRWSKDSGRTFGKPIRIDDGNPAGRLDVVSLPSGGAAASWIERSSQGVQVRVRRIDPSGTAGPSIVVSGTAGARSGGFPRMARSGNEIVIAWTDAAEKPRVRTAVLSVE
jgi:hypothetical protein